MNSLLSFPFTLIIVVMIIGSLFYLFLNMFWQLRAMKRLEKNIRNHRSTLEANFNKKVKESIISTHQDELILMLLRKEISDLKESKDRVVLQKTLDRKNYSNQKRFAFKIFSESGMDKVLKLA